MLPPFPASPAFTVSMVSGDPNRVVVSDQSVGYFDRYFGAPGAIPVGTKRAMDTLFFPVAGTYLITLYTSAEGGAGVARAEQSVTILQDATAACDPKISLLTGDCASPGRCWTLSRVAGAVRVGPQPGSSEWYTSPVNGLQAAQYDDRFCFYFSGSRFQYLNNGTTVDPWNGYAAVPYTPVTDATWFYSVGTGVGGLDQIILPDGSFMGVWDSGPKYDLVNLTEAEMVVRSKVVGNAGWFELTFVKN